MSAQVDNPSNGRPSAHAPSPGVALPLREQMSDALASLRRIVDLQVRMWLARVKNAAFRIAMFTLFATLALLLAIAALVWLYAGLYHVLTDVFHIPTVWSLLIFSGLHLLLAGILIAIGITILKGPKEKKSPGGTAS